MSKSREISASTLANSIACSCLACLCLMVGVVPASAYRPFDGTDAAVADKGKMEIEMQPAGILKDASGTTLIAPATLNAARSENRKMRGFFGLTPS